MKMNKCRAAIAAIGMGLAFASAPAAAAVTFFFPKTSLQDDNLDFVVDTDNSGTITLGDRFITVLEYNNTQGILAGQGPANILPTELAGVGDVTAVAVGPGGSLIFAPSGAAGLLSAFAPGTTTVLWHDTTPDLNVINADCGTRAQCIVLAGLGGADPGSSLFVSVGLFGDPDGIIVGTAASGPLLGASIATLQGGGSSSIFATFNFSQQIGINNTGLLFGEQACIVCGPGGNGLIQVTGSANVLGGEGLIASQWNGRSDNDVQVIPLPEPATVALLGLGLLGLGFGARKRNAS